MGYFYALLSNRAFIDKESYCGVIMKANNSLFDYFRRVFGIFVIALAVFILFQVLRKVFGGSWITEGVVLGLLLTNLSVTAMVALMAVGSKSDYGHLKRQFTSLALDFKSHVKETDNNFNRINRRLDSIEKTLISKSNL